jgi:hypothetical protein
MDTNIKIHAKKSDFRLIILGCVFQQALSQASGLHSKVLNLEDKKIWLLGHLPSPHNFAFLNTNGNSSRGMFEW